MKPTPQDRAAAHVARIALEDALTAFRAIDYANLPPQARNHWQSFIAGLDRAHNAISEMSKEITPRDPWPPRARRACGEWGNVD